MQSKDFWKPSKEAEPLRSIPTLFPTQHPIPPSARGGVYGVQVELQGEEVGGVVGGGVKGFPFCSTLWDTNGCCMYVWVGIWVQGVGRREMLGVGGVEGGWERCILFATDFGVAILGVVGSFVGVMGDPRPRAYTTAELEYLESRRVSLMGLEVDGKQPQQVHLNFGDDPASTMTVTWSTRNMSCSSVVVEGAGVKNRTYTGFFESWDYSPQFIHRVNLTGLSAGSMYRYHIACPSAPTFTSSFRTGKAAGAKEGWNPTMAVYGDMGLANERSLKSLIAGVEQGELDVVLHVGDIAYDLQDKDGTVGDAFQNSIQPIASRIPYETCPGNHESDVLASFGQFRARFGRSLHNGGPDGMFHKVELGLTTFLFLSSEVFFYPSEWGWGLIETQYNWLVATLESVDRSVTPWLVLGFHRPTACSANDDDDACHHQDNPVRVGVNGSYALEPLLHRYGVDLVISAHEHAYSRSWPRSGLNATQHNYDNPTAPVFIISGAAGCPENQDPWNTSAVAPWVALEQNVYGFGILSTPDPNTLHWSFYDVDNNKTSDAITIKQQQHKPFPYKL